jgi:CheY-like chemotaxis protein
MPNKNKILVIDDDAEFRAALSEQLSMHVEFEVVAAGMAARACRLPRRDGSIW